MNLVVVESPTKARTLGKFLGGDFKIEASYGHVRDLPQRKLGVKIAKDKFTLEYVQTSKQKDRTDEIKKLVTKATHIYLATDPDREGEAIAWHMAEIFDDQADAKTQRIVFHEITDRAIKNALAKPRKIDMQLVDAQQARRVLDRLVGYKLSPLLWKKVRKGLSAGRVQSVALRLIVEREREITAFVPVEFWQILVDLQDGKTQPLQVELKDLNDQEFAIASQSQAAEVEQELRQAKYQVASVERKDFARTPPAPFTTSTLQQAGANKLGWSAKKTMQVAQGLYEEGWITYHRTDSTNLADDATAMAADFITKTYGGNYALDKPRLYPTKSKVAQEAHEAIRPTDANLTSLPAEAMRDQLRLYELIWRRFVACQMGEARGETMTVSVAGQAQQNKYSLQAKGETLSFDGWYKVYGKAEDVDEKLLPQLAAGEKLEFVNLTSAQKFTQPPARYNDASLIKILEEKGIGRPSTYAPTISTILERLYVEKVDKRFQPTALGIAVCDFLVTNFGNILDYDFTAEMEDKLDLIADGKLKWQPTVSEFYTPFASKLEQVAATAQKVKIEVEETGNPCPKCTSTGSAQVGREIIRMGRFGKFLACSRFPDCDYKATYLNKTGQKCPKCMTGDVIIKRTRSSKTFFGCSNYPTCDFASWTKPK